MKIEGVRKLEVTKEPNVGSDGKLIDLDALREADERNEEV
jgi:hypothetical protein